jgi:hypothetical protein
MSNTYIPSSLPKITSVEICVLGMRSEDESQPRFITIGRTGFQILDNRTVSGEEALAIAELWRKLPPDDDQDRCHYPPFGLRFYQGDELLLSASICWECRNIWLKAGEARYGYFLDGEHEISQSLLKLLKQLSGS